MSEPEKPTLTSAQSTGGLNAQAGFGYQVWDALLRLPAWLKMPAFDGLLFEGLEDAEARFFAPLAPNGHVLDRFQAKSAVLTRSELIAAIENFHAFTAAHPDVARVQTIVTPQLPSTLAWIARDPARIRRARPFYRPFPEIAAASDDKLRNDLDAEFGVRLGEFVASEVEIFLRPVSDQLTAEAAFSVAFHAAFPDFDLGARQSGAAFGALLRLARDSPGVMLTRARLVECLSEAVERDLGLPSTLAIHVRSDRGEENSVALEIDAEPFSGSGGVFPSPAIWTASLVNPLQTTARWARKRGYSRIGLSGSFRLSTAFVLGHAFKSAIGFDLDIPTRESTWSTDDRSAPGEQPPAMDVSQPSCLHHGRLVVCVGIIRRPLVDVLNHLGATDEAVLSLVASDPVPNGRTAQALVSGIKTHVAEAAARFTPEAIDLFFVGPAALAVALGHRWNGLPPTRLHEFNAASCSYSQSALVV